MLIRFSVQNYLSFFSEQTLNMIASADTRHPEHIIAATPDTKLLRATVFYGANGAGKSNLVQALAFAQDLVLNGTKPKEEIPVRPFRLAAEDNPEPTKFEFDIFAEGRVYNYGFVANRTKVLEEWLFLGAGKREEALFERTTNGGDTVTVEAGSRLTRGKQDAADYLAYVAKGTRPNQLFLYELRDKNYENLNKETIKPVLAWFDETLQIIEPESGYPNLAEAIHSDPQLARFAGTYLCEADTGVHSLEVKVSDVQQGISPLSVVLDCFGKAMAKAKGDRFYFDALAGEKVFLGKDKEGHEKFGTLRAVHKRRDGSDAAFGFAEESDGTRRLLHLLPALYHLRSKPHVLFIDEIDRSLHPLLSRQFLGFFLSSCSGCPSQLILTTHETHLLDLDILRRDEIWFAEKKDGETRMYSLADFKIRPDLQVRKGYLNGRFGAIPFLGDFSKLCEERTGGGNLPNGDDPPQTQTAQ